MRSVKTLITLLIVLLWCSLGNICNAELTVGGKYKVKGNKTIYTKQLKHYTKGDKKPKHLTKGDTWEKKNGKKYIWNGTKWEEIL